MPSLQLSYPFTRLYPTRSHWLINEKEDVDDIWRVFVLETAEIGQFTYFEARDGNNNIVKFLVEADDIETDNMLDIKEVLYVNDDVVVTKFQKTEDSPHEIRDMLVSQAVKSIPVKVYTPGDKIASSSGNAITRVVARNCVDIAIDRRFHDDSMPTFVNQNESINRTKPLQEQNTNIVATAVRNSQAKSQNTLVGLLQHRKVANNHELPTSGGNTSTFWSQQQMSEPPQSSQNVASRQLQTTYQKWQDKPKNNSNFWSQKSVSELTQQKRRELKVIKKYEFPVPSTSATTSKNWGTAAERRAPSSNWGQPPAKFPRLNIDRPLLIPCKSLLTI